MKKRPQICEHSRRSRHSSRVMTTSRELSPFAHVSSAVNHVSSSSTKVQGRVQSRTIITSEEESVDRGSKKWDSKAVKADAEDGTVYTESLANVSGQLPQWSSSIGKANTKKTYLHPPHRGRQQSHTQSQSPFSDHPSVHP